MIQYKYFSELNKIFVKLIRQVELLEYVQRHFSRLFT
jgi:hypothetical protein